MLIRFSYLFLICTLAIAAFLFVHFNRQETETAASYVGTDRCRVCHEAVAAGRQFRRWQETPHVGAFAILSSDSARAWLDSNGASIDDCLGCHSTLGRRALNSAEQRVNEEGIGCERCHGAGSRYAFYGIMKDHPAFAANGGVTGSLDDCYSCHARSIANAERHCPFQRADFNADTAWLEIRHPLPANMDTPDTVQDLRTQ